LRKNRTGENQEPRTKKPRQEGYGYEGSRAKSQESRQEGYGYEESRARSQEPGQEGYGYEKSRAKSQESRQKIYGVLPNCLSLSDVQIFYISFHILLSGIQTIFVSSHFPVAILF